MTAPSIKNLRMRDNLADPGTDVDLVTAGLSDERPGPQVGHRPGRLELPRRRRRHSTGLVCDYGGITAWRVTTSVPSWTPLGSGWNGVKPYPDWDAGGH